MQPTSIKAGRTVHAVVFNVDTFWPPHIPMLVLKIAPLNILDFPAYLGSFSSVIIWHNALCPK
jgi:hypothetical protein